MLTARKAIAVAEERVGQAEIRITRQMMIVARLAAIGQDTTAAEAVLDDMRDTLRRTYEHLDRVRARVDMCQ